MPRYEFRCRACGETFEVSRPMSQATASATCPAGHDDTVRLLSTIALTGGSAAPSAGACGSSCGCGGSCGCGT